MKNNEKRETIMTAEKKNDVNTELKDEELNDATGGAGRRDRSEMISCKRCGKPIPAHSTVAYCGDCLIALRKAELRPSRHDL